ncbi:ATP-binding protein [bacterium]|nr:ATP-binding protein [bacterium]
MEKIKLILDEWFHSSIPELKERNFLSVDFPEGMGVVITGVRRSGKTYTLFELARKLRNLYPPYNIVYLNFEDERLLPLEGKEMQMLISVIKENFKIDKNKPLWLLLDEIQVVPEWWSYVRGIIDRKEARIVVTGSSAGLTLEKISSKLAGRVLIKSLYPLGFREFLEFKGVPFKNRSLLYSLQSDILYYLQEFLQFGGFPKIVFVEKEEEKREFLTNYFYTIFYRDIIERFSIRKIFEFESFIRLVLKQTGTFLSISRIVSFMKSLGFKISKPTVIEYLNYACNSLLVYPVEIFSYKLKDRLQYPKKIYCVDTGFINLTKFKLKIDWGSVLENAVFIELLRRGKEVFYWKDERGYEVDFVEIRNMKPVSLIQVCWEPEGDIVKREVRALLKAMHHFGLKEGVIITRNFSHIKRTDDKVIIFKPFWKWVLKEDKQDV